MNPEADDPETVAIHESIAHIADVYHREGEDGLAKHVAELISSIEATSKQRENGRNTKSCYQR